MTWLKPYYVTFVLLVFMVLKHGIGYVMFSLRVFMPTAGGGAASAAGPSMISDAAVVAVTGVFFMLLTRLGLASVAWVLLLPTLAVLVASTIMFGIESVGAWRQRLTSSPQRPTAPSSPGVHGGVATLLHVQEGGHSTLHFLRSLQRSHAARFL